MDSQASCKARNVAGLAQLPDNAHGPPLAQQVKQRHERHAAAGTANRFTWCGYAHSSAALARTIWCHICNYLLAWAFQPHLLRKHPRRHQRALTHLRGWLRCPQGSRQPHFQTDLPCRADNFRIGHIVIMPCGSIAVSSGITRCSFGVKGRGQGLCLDHMPAKSQTLHLVLRQGYAALVHQYDARAFQHFAPVLIFLLHAVMPVHKPAVHQIAYGNKSGQTARNPGDIFGQRAAKAHQGRESPVHKNSPAPEA